MQLSIDQLIDGKYRIIDQLGQGGMGEVYRAEHVRIGRKVAIKVLHASCAQDLSLVRFEREAQAAGRIGNDHILEVLDFGSLPDGSPYLVAELLEGETLERRVATRGRLPPADAVRIVRGLLDGLAAAHGAGVLHRDLKPSNVFLLREKAGLRDFVKIIDFGVSKFLFVANDGLRMTATGALVGTPYYLAPEQIVGTAPADARCDLYSVGVILYELVTGRTPYECESLPALMVKIATGTPRAPEQLVPDLDPALADLMKRAIARDPAMRFQSALEFRGALTDWAQSASARPSYLPAGAAGRGGTSTVPRTAAPSVRPCKTELMVSPTGHAPATPSDFASAKLRPSRRGHAWLWTLAGGLAVAGALALWGTWAAFGQNWGAAVEVATAREAGAAPMQPAVEAALAVGVAAKPSGAPSAILTPLASGSAAVVRRTRPRTGTRTSPAPPAAPSLVPSTPAAPPPTGTDMRDFGY